MSGKGVYWLNKNAEEWLYLWKAHSGWNPMSQPGKPLRLRRLLGADGRGVVVPMDHGVSDGPLPGLERPAETTRKVVAGGADSVIVHKGVARAVASSLGDAGFWLHVSAGTSLNPDANDKR